MAENIVVVVGGGGGGCGGVVVVVVVGGVVVGVVVVLLLSPRHRGRGWLCFVSLLVILIIFLILLALLPLLPLSTVSNSLFLFSFAHSSALFPRFSSRSLPIGISVFLASFPFTFWASNVSF